MKCHVHGSSPESGLFAVLFACGLEVFLFWWVVAANAVARVIMVAVYGPRLLGN